MLPLGQDCKCYEYESAWPLSARVQRELSFCLEYPQVTCVRNRIANLMRRHCISYLSYTEKKGNSLSFVSYTARFSGIRLEIAMTATGMAPPSAIIKVYYLPSLQAVSNWCRNKL